MVSYTVTKPPYIRLPAVWCVRKPVHNAGLSLLMRRCTVHIHVNVVLLLFDNTWACRPLPTWWIITKPVNLEPARLLMDVRAIVFICDLCEIKKRSVDNAKDLDIPRPAQAPSRRDIEFSWLPRWIRTTSFFWSWTLWLSAFAARPIVSILKINMRCTLFTQLIDSSQLLFYCLKEHDGVWTSNSYTVDFYISPICAL